jgi:hypothetical protein
VTTFAGDGRKTAETSSKPATRRDRRPEDSAAAPSMAGPKPCVSRRSNSSSRSRGRCCASLHLLEERPSRRLDRLDRNVAPGELPNRTEITGLLRMVIGLVRHSDEMDVDLGPESRRRKCRRV